MEFNLGKLPTREQCQDIISKTEAFYCTKREVQGFEIELYDYRLASYTDYVNNNAFELRGLCFVNNNGTWERNILMQKFFNLNETQDWMYEDVKDKKVDMVQVKEDGSVITFIRLPNGNVVAKSKMSFDSDQAIMAQKIYDNNEVIRNFVNFCLDTNLVPIFELVSPFNQIVLVYDDTQLRLLQVRDNLTGKYLNIYKLYYSYFGSVFDEDNDENKAKIVLTQRLRSKLYSSPTLEDLMEMQVAEQNVEGWVVTLEDGQMLKIKTAWYFAAHHLTTSNITRENLLLELVLTDQLDDVLCVVQGEKKKYLEEMSSKIQHYFNHKVTEYKSLRGLYFNKFQEDRKEFAMKHKNDELFNAVMKTLDTSFRDIEETAKKAVKDYLLKKYNTLTSAKEFLNSLASE